MQQLDIILFVSCNWIKVYEFEYNIFIIFFFFKQCEIKITTIQSGMQKKIEQLK